MKNKEIERRFWVDIDNIPDLSKYDYRDITQGYANGLGDYQFRLRQVINMTPDEAPLGEQYYQTIKSFGNMVRDEFEIHLLKPQFSTLWGLCMDKTLHKHRYKLIGTDDPTIVLDVFKNDLDGLILTEVEFNSVEEANAYKPESWFDFEVTDDYRFKNYNLTKHKLADILKDGTLKLECLDCGKLFNSARPHKCVNDVKNNTPNFKLIKG